VIKNVLLCFQLRCRLRYHTWPLVAHVMNKTSPLLNNPAVNVFKELQTKIYLGVHIGVYQGYYNVKRTLDPTWLG